MQELQKISPDKTELHAIKPVKKELKHIGTLVPQRGHFVWELNLQTKRIQKAEFQKVDAEFTSQKVHKSIIVNPDCIYCTALNHKSADRKFFKMLGLKYPNKK